MVLTLGLFHEMSTLPPPPSTPARLQVALSEVFHALVAKSGGNSDSGTGMDARDTGDTGDTGYIGDCRDTGCTGNTGDAEHFGDTGDTGGTGDTGNAAAVAGAPFLPRQGVEDWLVKINRKLGRGSEFRSAEAFMGPAPGGGLTLEGGWCLCVSVHFSIAIACMAGCAIWRWIAVADV